MRFDAFDHLADFVGAMNIEIERDAAALEFAVDQFVQILAVIDQQQLFHQPAVGRQGVIAEVFAAEGAVHFLDHLHQRKAAVDFRLLLQPGLQGLDLRQCGGVFQAVTFAGGEHDFHRCHAG